MLVTAYVNYALDGYKVKVSRFLLKDDLDQTLPECLDDIIYIETSRHKNVFYTSGETYSIYKKMDELEAELAGLGFVRIHQRFLINMRYIGKLSSYVMVLTMGKEISVTKSRYPEVKQQRQAGFLVTYQCREAVALAALCRVLSVVQGKDRSCRWKVPGGIPAT